MRRFHTRRVIHPEILDHQTPDRAAPALRDIVRINRLTGGHAVLRLRLSEIVSRRDSFSILDIGAGSGDAGDVVRAEYPNARVLSLDHRIHHLQNAPRGSVVADAFRLPFRPGSVDVAYCGLFLHHFADDEIVELLRAAGHVARRFLIVNDLERHILPYYFLPVTRPLFGWDPITLNDGPISVQAAFSAGEMRSLAKRAGLADIDVRTHRPAFRVSMVARVPGDTLRE